MSAKQSSVTGKSSLKSQASELPNDKDIEKEIQKELGKISRAFNSNQFSSFISHIRFLNFKSLENKERVDFTFPITVMVGQNGSGKSSVLHALYGSPDKTGEKGVEKYWFSTKTDPIGKEKPRFIFGYKTAGSSEIKEVLRQRMPRKVNKDGEKRPNPDYWETAKPSLQLGMKEDSRNPPPKMPSRYYHFRNEVGAFERAFYNYQEKLPVGIKSRSIQDYIRLKSSFLKKVIDEDAIIKWGRKKTPQNEPLKTLTTNSTIIANHILGKNYTKNKLVKHRFFISWGQSATFEDNINTYTDANAGSGEIGILSFLHLLDNTQPHSLLLLDEPEISLHPGAQKKLVYHLLKFCLEKKVQIVVSTHSPVIVSLFPQEAIKVFCRNHASAKYRIIQDCNPIEAFEEIGHSYQSATIFVEDCVAQLIVEGCLKESGVKGFKVRIHPGGAKDMFASACTYSSNGDDTIFFYFDGDMKPSDDFLAFDENQCSKIELSPERLKKRISNEFNMEPRTASSSGDSKDSEQATSLLNLIRFLQKRCFYLPKNLPEDIIWSDDLAKKLLGIGGSIKGKSLSNELGGLSSKEKFLNFAVEFFGSREVPACQKLFLKTWLEEKNADYDLITNSLKNDFK